MVARETGVGLRLRLTSARRSVARYRSVASSSWQCECDGGAMSDWFHELPVSWMALLVFGFTYLLALAMQAGVAALARSGRAKSFKAASPDMLPPPGIIFGLFVAFTSAPPLSDNYRASAS